MKIKLLHTFKDVVSVNNLLEAWLEFLNGKKQKKDVQEFQFYLMDNILSLHRDIINLNYRHGGYQKFKIDDPKPRVIHKATVRDRLLHRAVYRILYPFFERTFISDSFSCQMDKGTHKAIKRFRLFVNKVSENNTKTCWVLKCDIKKFFASIDQVVLMKALQEYVFDKDIIILLSKIIGSFYSTKIGKGLPLGNLTSQLFSNIYMNKFDQFVKHQLKARHYVRYADDFVILSQDKKCLEGMVSKISVFLLDNLKLQLHPNKVFITTIASGVDFLGWVNFPDHRVLRNKTKKRMLKRIKNNPSVETLNSYLGLIKHGAGHKLENRITL
jgi:retron-type reverse transcriptase